MLTFFGSDEETIPVEEIKGRYKKIFEDSAWYPYPNKTVSSRN
jgi:hypothetical protein